MTRPMGLVQTYGTPEDEHQTYGTPTDRERLDAAMGAIRILGREVRALRAEVEALRGEPK